MVRIKFELRFSSSSHSIVMFFFPVGLSSLSRYFQQVLLGVKFLFPFLAWTPNVNSPSQETEDTSTPNKTFWKCRDNDGRPTGKKNTTFEWDDGERGNSNLILTENLPSAHETWYNYLFLSPIFPRRPIQCCFFFPVGLLSLMGHF